MAFDEGLGRGMPKAIDVGDGPDDQYRWVAPGVPWPIDTEFNASTGTTTQPNQKTPGGSAYSSYGGTSQFPFPGGGNSFSSILGQLLGGAMGKTAGTMPGSPPVLSSPSPDLGPSAAGGSEAPVGGQGVSPALTSILRDSDSTAGGNTIQAIMAKLLRQKRPNQPVAY
jgi:hypothetical protein